MIDPNRYVPTALELEGESHQYCFGQPVVIPPPPTEDPVEHAIKAVNTVLGYLHSADY